LAALPRRSIIRPPAALVGAGLLLRAISNLPIRRFLGIAGRAAIQVQKTIEVYAPAEEVFELWSNPENFPRFMSHVREVRRLENSRYHWVVTGPAGVSVSWDSEITQLVPNELLAWRSAPGSIIGNAGIIRFPPGDGATRIHVRVSYNPPGGALVHLFANL